MPKQLQSDNDNYNKSKDNGKITKFNKKRKIKLCNCRD